MWVAIFLLIAIVLVFAGIRVVAAAKPAHSRCTAHADDPVSPWKPT